MRVEFSTFFYFYTLVLASKYVKEHGKYDKKHRLNELVGLVINWMKIPFFVDGTLMAQAVRC